MRVFSRHRDLISSKMRFLILSAILACATAAPSGLIAPAVPVVPAVAYSAIPTISPGDLQAAAIDAKVKAEDFNRAAADRAIELTDKARELSEQAAESLNEKVISTNDQVKEKVAEEFWSVEDKKWQAIDALKTAEAQFDGSVASQADTIAKSALVLPYAAIPVAGPAVAPIAPVVAPFSPVVAPAFYPGFVAPALKTAEPKPEEKPEPAKFEEPIVKAGEGIKEGDKDSVAVEAIPATVAKPIEAKPFVAPIYAAPFPAPFGFPIPYGYPVQNFGLTPFVAKYV